MALRAILHGAPGPAGFDAERLGMVMAKEMHADSDGFVLLYGANGGMTRAKKEPASRWLNGSGVFTTSVLAQSVKLPDQTVFSVIAIVG